MKTITKFLTLILSLFCVFGLINPVYAEGEDNLTALHVYNESGEVAYGTSAPNTVIPLDKGQTYTFKAEGTGTTKIDSIVKLVEESLQNSDGLSYKMGESNSTTSDDGTYTWNYEFTLTPTIAGPTYQINYGDGATRSISINVSENDDPYFIKYAAWDDSDSSTSTEIASNKTDAYDYTFTVGKSYGISFNWKGALKSSGQNRLDKFTTTGFFEAEEGSALTDEGKATSFWQGWEYYCIKPTKAGTTTVEIFEGKPITFHIVDESETSTDDYLTVTNFEDKTVTSGTELSGTFTTDWKNTDGHSWFQELYGSSDGGKTWEGIASYGSAGSDRGPKFVSTKDSGYQLKLVCTLDEKEIYNKVITITVVDKTSASETTEGTPTTSASYDEQTLIDTLKESSYLTDEQKEAAKFGEISIKTTASKIEPTTEDKSLVEAQLNSTNKIAMYLDLKVVASVTKNGTKFGDDVTVRETGTPVKFTIALDDSFINTKNTVDRTYQVVRIHNGVVDVLPATFNADSKTITFETDKFSTYAVMYTDTPKASKTPSTADNMNVALYGGVAVVSVLAIGFLFFFKKRNA